MNWTKIIPRWSGDVIEPPESKKDEGYVAGDKPPAKWENWFRKGVSEALEETQDNVDLCGDAIKGITGKSNVSDVPDITLAETKTIADDFVAHKADLVTQVGGVHGFDVEEGTWPIIIKNSVSVQLTLSSVNARYVKHGNNVDCYFSFVIDTTTNETVYLTIEGIPFAPNQPVFHAGTASQVQSPPGQASIHRISIGLGFSAIYPLVTAQGATNLLNSKSIRGKFSFQI